MMSLWNERRIEDERMIALEDPKTGSGNDMDRWATIN